MDYQHITRKGLGLLLSSYGKHYARCLTTVDGESIAAVHSIEDYLWERIEGSNVSKSVSEIQGPHARGYAAVELQRLEQ